MLRVTININDNRYPIHRFRCPKCGVKYSFIDTAPLLCKSCLKLLPSIKAFVTINDPLRLHQLEHWHKEGGL
jgi:hypothetical protein